MKGQYFSFDTVVAAILFFLTVSLLFNYWGYVNQNRSVEDRKLYANALEYSITLENRLMGQEKLVPTPVFEVSINDQNLLTKTRNDLGLGEDVCVKIYYDTEIIPVIDCNSNTEKEITQSAFRMIEYNTNIHNITVVLSK